MALPEDLIRKMAAEAIGTFILVLAGTGALMIGRDTYPLAFGFALVGIVYALGHISGAHVNPAVTVGLAATGRFPIPHVPYYIGAQVVGALLASLFLRLIYGNVRSLGSNSVAEGYSALDGFLVELVATAVFVFVIAAVATDKRVPPAAVGLAIGGTLLVIQIFAAVSGGSVNPARSLGPALASWTMTDIWIYLTAPFIGAVIGAVAYEFVRGPEGWAEDRPGPEQAPPGDQRRQRPPQQQQRRRQPGLADSDLDERPRRPQRPQPPRDYEQELHPPDLDDPESPPPARPAQRPPRQRPPEYDPNAPRQAPRQRRPPQE